MRLSALWISTIGLLAVLGCRDREQSDTSVNKVAASSATSVAGKSDPPSDSSRPAKQKMKQLSFFGLGDGKFGGGSDNPNDEESYHDNYASGTPIVYLISSGRHSLYVVGQYDRKVAGTWRVGVEMPDKGEFPPWRIWYERQHEYSPIIVLEVPKDAKVVDVTTKFSAK